MCINQNKINIQLEYNLKKKKLPNVIFKSIISFDNLKLAWYQLKSHFSKRIEIKFKKIFNQVSDDWVLNINKKIIKNKFKYFSQNYRSILKSKFEITNKFLFIIDFKSKIVEKAFFNFFRTFLKVSWTWRKVNLKKYNKLKQSSIRIFQEFKIIRKKMFVKHWFQKLIIDYTNFEIIPRNSFFYLLHSIKSWQTNITFVFKGNISRALSILNYNRLKKMFNNYKKCFELWNEMSKMFNFWSFKINSSWYNKNKLLTFLFERYLNEFDIFIFWLSNKKWISKKKIQKCMFWRTHTKILHCVRYLTNFVIGVTSSYNTLNRVSDQICLFLQNYLYFQKVWKKIVERRKKSLLFLGYRINFFNCSNSKVIKDKYFMNSNSKAWLKSKIKLKASLTNIFKQLMLNGFLNFKNNKPSVNSQLLIFNNSVILQCYSNVIRRIFEYYSFADNFNCIKNVFERLRKGCVLTIATKHKKNFKWFYNTYRLDAKIFTYMLRVTKSFSNILKHLRTMNIIKKNVYKNI